MEGCLSCVLWLVSCVGARFLSESGGFGWEVVSRLLSLACADTQWAYQDVAKSDAIDDLCH